MFQPSKLLSLEQYSAVADAFHLLAETLLIEFTRRAPSGCIRDQISRNFIARTDVQVRAIFQLWQMGDVTDCLTLYRTLLDRLFHLHHVSTTDEFQEFDDWSFGKLYEAALRLRTDANAKELPTDLWSDLTPERAARYAQLRKKPSDWRRPQAKAVAEDMGMTFFYRYGYDYASRYVHPMSTDGEEDLLRIMDPTQAAARLAGQIVVLSNSILVATLIAQTALNASSLSWMNVAYDAIDGVRRFTVSVDAQDNLPLAKIIRLSAENMAFAAAPKHAAAP